MFQLQHVTITHRKDLRKILVDFNAVFHPGDKAVIIGEEGNGKSTLLKWIYDPALVEDYAEAEGVRICSGEKLGYLPQELREEDREKSVYEYFCEEPLFADMTGYELENLSRKLHFEQDRFYSAQTMGSLSGGERVKTEMARLLISRPSVYLLDEPSNDIDIETLEWMERLITGVKGIVLYVSHDETLIERTANRIILIEQLHRKTVPQYTIVSMGFAEFMEKRRHDFDKQKQVALGERREEKMAMEKFRRIEQSVEHAQNVITRQDPHTGRLLKKKMASVKAMERRYSREHDEQTEIPDREEAMLVRLKKEIPMPAGKTVLDITIPELHVTASPESGEEDRVLSRDIQLKVRGPEKVCIVGKNGSGKTTLIRCIASQLMARPDLHVCYMPQNYEEVLDMDQTPVEYLAESGRKEDVTMVRTYLGSMKYTLDEMDHAIRELSGGQKAKILLLKMSITDVDVLLLDEPTRNFSPLSGPVIREVFRRFPGAIISVSHDRKYIDEVCNAVYELTPEGLRRTR